MKIRRCPFWLLAALCLVVVGHASQTLLAQSSLPQSIIQKQSDLTDQEKATVDQFVDTYVKQMQSDAKADVAEARTRLGDPISLGPSASFLGYYLPALAKRVAPLIKPDQPLLVRLNVAILSAKLNGQDLVRIIQDGAADPSPAVRYWIAKSAGEAAKNSVFDTPQQQDVLTVLADRLKNEDTSYVLEQVMIALSQIQLPQATQAVLDGLDSRVTFHKSNPTARFKPIQNGMQELWRKLIADRADQKNVTKQLYELGRIALRYYALIAEQMPDYENPADEPQQDIKNDKAQMAKSCVDVMTYVVSQVANLSAPLPVDTTKSADLAASRDLWRDIFKGPPFNYSDQDLSTGQADQ